LPITYDNAINDPRTNAAGLDFACWRDLCRVSIGPIPATSRGAVHRDPRRRH